MRTYRTTEELENKLVYIQKSPSNNGVLSLIVRRPEVDQREELERGVLNFEEGLVGDNWKIKPSSKTIDNSPYTEMQLTIMNVRAIDAICDEKERWKLAGDQLFIDLNLNEENLPSGSHLSIGSAVVEITPVPHNGCKPPKRRRV